MTKDVEDAAGDLTADLAARRAELALRLGRRVGDAVPRLSDRFGSAEADGLRLPLHQLANRFG